MKKVVFINPPLSVEDRYGVKSQSGGETPPLGLTNLAAMTRKYGYKSTIIDAPALKMDYDDIVKEVIRNEFVYVGIGAATISIGHAARLARKIKDADKKIKIIIGGPHLSALPIETMENYSEFDIGVIGEADYTIIELLTALDLDKDLGEVNGLVLRKNGNLWITPQRKRIDNLDELPMPAWDLLPNLAEYYCPPVHTLNRIPAGLLVASRGCPGRCTFCARTVFGNFNRAYSAAYTFEMIEDLYNNYGIREIQIRDDNFTAYRNRMIELCELLKRAKLDLVWTCAARVDMVTAPILQTMKEAGCWQIWYGIESGSQAILDGIKKNTTLEQIEKAVIMTHEVGISPCGFFIIGHPGETRESLEATIQLATKLPLGDAHFGFMTPFPGSEIYPRAKEFGKFDDDWSKLSGWVPVFVPHGLTVGELEGYSKKAFRKFYFRPRIVFSYIKRIRTWRHLKIYFSGFMALLEFLVKSKREKVKF